MATEVKRLIRVRVEKGANFKRDGFGKKRQLSDSWRKPRGQHNKQREQKKAKGALPKPGFGSPVAVRGMHPSGFFEVLVFSIKELERLDPKTQAVRIAASVGNRKRVVLQDAALAAGLKVLNARTMKATAKKAPVKKEEARDEGKQKKKEKKPAMSKAKAPAKKEAKKEKTVKPRAEPEEKTEKKAPAKKETPAKKAAVKPRAEKTAEAKPAVKKASKSGVKKNE